MSALRKGEQEPPIAAPTARSSPSSTTAREMDWPRHDICQPHDNDVLVHRDTSLLVLVGTFENVIRNRSTEFATKTRTEQPVVAFEILQDWREQEPPGRFLKYDPAVNMWNDIGDFKARQKIGKALRGATIAAATTENHDDVGDGFQQYQGSSAATLQSPNDAVSPATTLRYEESRPVEREKSSERLSYGNAGKLFGRSKEEAVLHEMYERIKDPSTTALTLSRATAFVLISGTSGVGKTALAHSFRSTVSNESGLFIEGKFEQLETLEPLSAFGSVLTSFATLIKALDEKVAIAYREAIQKEVGDDVQLLTWMAPSLLDFLGPKDNVVWQPGQGADKRFEYAFRRFLRALMLPGKPVVLFLDDLHWASAASLDVFKSLVTDVVNRRVVFVATRRCDGLRTNPYLTEWLTRLYTDQVQLHHIELGNLEQSSVNDMLATTLSLDSKQIDALGETVFSFTGGNALFILELLRSLQDDDLLRFDEEKEQWTCDNQLIPSLIKPGTTVRDLFKSKILDLPADVRETLMVASCLGSKLDEFLLRQIRSGLISTHFEMGAAKGLIRFDEVSACFMFAHDGVQQAVYALIPVEERELYHRRIGGKILKNLDPDKLDDFVFVTVRQLILGRRLLSNDRDRAVVASMCLQAGEKAALNSTGFQTALVYLGHGIDLLGPRRWRNEYRLCLRLYNAAAEASYCTAQFDEVGKLVDEVKSNARNFDDTLQASSTQIYTLSSSGQLPAAIGYALATLNDLGEKFPHNPSPAQEAMSRWRTHRLLRGLTDVQLLRLPPMVDPRKIAVMQILNLLFLSAVYSRPRLGQMIVFRMVRLTVEHGACAISCVGFAFYGMVLCGGGFGIEEGYRFGKLAMQMYNEVKAEAWFCRVSAAFYGCICPWKMPIRSTLSQLKDAYHLGLRTGDIEYATLNASMRCWHLLNGKLDFLDTEFRTLAERMDFFGQSTSLWMLRPMWQMIHNFQGLAHGDIKELTGEIMDQEATVIAARKNIPSLLLWIRFYRLMLAYHFSDYEMALELSVGLSELYNNYFGAMHSAQVLFYECLAHLATGKKNDRGRLRYVRSGLKRLAYWATHSPATFLASATLSKQSTRLQLGIHCRLMGSLFRQSCTLVKLAFSCWRHLPTRGPADTL